VTIDVKAIRKLLDGITDETIPVQIIVASPNPLADGLYDIAGATRVPPDASPATSVTITVGSKIAQSK
jgi:hypothetical protein